MTAKEAYTLLVNKLGSMNMEVVKCFEYQTLFTFQLAPKNFKNPDGLLDSVSSVNKKTREVRDFKPFHIPIEEYDSGKEIRDFK